MTQNNLSVEQLLLQHNLISQLLSTENKNVNLKHIEKIIHQVLVAFSNEYPQVKLNEVKIFIKLQNILKELNAVSACPNFYKKRKVAVAGGFSSGKSEFISSFFINKKFKLSIGIEPTTAIPTYVMNNDDTIDYIQDDDFKDYYLYDEDLISDSNDISEGLRNSTHHLYETIYAYAKDKITPNIFKKSNTDSRL